MSDFALDLDWEVELDLGVGRWMEWTMLMTLTWWSRWKVVFFASMFFLFFCVVFFDICGRGQAGGWWYHVLDR